MDGAISENERSSEDMMVKKAPVLEPRHGEEKVNSSKSDNDSNSAMKACTPDLQGCEDERTMISEEEMAIKFPTLEPSKSYDLAVKVSTHEPN